MQAIYLVDVRMAVVVTPQEELFPYILVPAAEEVSSSLRIGIAENWDYMCLASLHSVGTRSTPKEDGVMSIEQSAMVAVHMLVGLEQVGRIDGDTDRTAGDLARSPQTAAVSLGHRIDNSRSPRHVVVPLANFRFCYHPD